ncbi:hypothetical protein Pla52o_21400 [Novipirellula galeiformis]|uniref:Uncharacterized protein n=1 Tax=Novipirellula galeiformis TaxID=2528004 RepID=A0A5C6CL99_9BACT|nr:hypothetical protein Pla52o_21400 [Novipirellula galeiformis]
MHEGGTREYFSSSKGARPHSRSVLCLLYTPEASKTSLASEKSNLTFHCAKDNTKFISSLDAYLTLLLITLRHFSRLTEPSDGGT